MSSRAQIYIKLLTFAEAKNACGKRMEQDVQINVPNRFENSEGSVSLKNVLLNLEAKFPQLSRVLPFCLVAVNHTYVSADIFDTVLIENNAIIALIPPVSGG